MLLPVSSAPLAHWDVFTRKSTPNSHASFSCQATSPPWSPLEPEEDPSGSLHPTGRQVKKPRTMQKDRAGLGTLMGLDHDAGGGGGRAECVRSCLFLRVVVT